MESELWLYFLAVLAVILLPGMDMAFVLASSVAAGTRGAVQSVLGMAAGGIVHVAVGATGVAALMVVFPQVFHLLLMLGTAYLLWIGWHIFRTADGAPDAETAQQAPGASWSGVAIFRRALVTCLLNPKAYAFSFAVIPAFVREDPATGASPLATRILALAAITAATQIVVYGGVAAVAVRARHFLQARKRPIARAMGAMLMGAALATATQAWSSAPEVARPPSPATVATVPVSTEKPGRGDFDFLTGTWQTVQRRSLRPLQDDAPWETFEAVLNVQKLPGAMGNIDSMVAPGWRPGWTGVTLRVFNGETGLWSIYWMAGKTSGIDSATGQLAVPVVGRFENGVGIFECDETIDGRALRVRYTWTPVDVDTVKWQQAFSFDGGKTWTPNWFMTGRRAQGKAQ